MPIKESFADKQNSMTFEQHQNSQQCIFVWTALLPVSLPSPPPAHIPEQSFLPGLPIIPSVHLLSFLILLLLPFPHALLPGRGLIFIISVKNDVFPKVILYENDILSLQKRK